jgi:hypothetical protein
MEEKQCKTCNLIKPLEQYRKYTQPENSYSIKCKKCLNEKDKIRKINLRKKKLENSLAKCEICQEEKILKYFAKLKKFYKKKICVSCYPDFLREQKNAWCKKESESNINYRLKKSLASRLRNVILKEDTTMNYIGCNIQYLREWFEYNFTEEMNWDNYGTLWSIGHIIPVCKFDLTNETEKLKCWNWSNLMPVTIKFNLSKKEINMGQINNILKQIENFKEEGSTTKWFSEEYIFTKTVTTKLEKIEVK